jgi:hypothetical protein
VVLGVAAGTQQKAFVCLGLDVSPISVGERSCVQLKSLRMGLAMAELERSQVASVTADYATSTKLHHQLELPAPASLQLLAVALVMVVRMPVLAVPRA